MSEDAESATRLRAYVIWEREGRPEGRHLEHWFLAQREIARTSAAGGISGGESPAEQEQQAPSSPHPAIFQSV
jgi:hypothetical protein